MMRSCCFFLAFFFLASAHASDTLLPKGSGLTVAARKLMVLDELAVDEVAEGPLGEEVGDVAETVSDLSFMDEDVDGELVEELDSVMDVGSTVESEEELLECAGKDACDKINRKLLKAARTGDLKTVQVALKKGGNVLAMSPSGYSPIHLAAKGGYTAVVKKLLSSTSVDLQALNGQTALHLAAIFNNQGVAQVLIYAGAMVKIKDGKGKTPLQLAKENENAKIVALLKQHGG